MGIMDGKYVLVTASTQGIGLAIAEECLKEGAKKVVINGRKVEKLEKLVSSLTEKYGENRVSYSAGDLSISGVAKSVVADAISCTDGKLNVVINSAGVSTRGDILDTNAELLSDLFTLNTFSAFFTSQAAIEHFIDNNIDGTIIHNVSVNAVCGERRLLPYSMSKAALKNLCENLGHDMSMRHAEAKAANKTHPWIRVLGILTGWVYTPGEEGYKRAEEPDAPKDWSKNPPLAAVPRGTMTQPEEIATFFTFLASDQASFLNAQVYTAEQICLAGSPPRNLT